MTQGRRTSAQRQLTVRSSRWRGRLRSAESLGREGRLARAGAVVAIVASILGLLMSGAATLYGARVADDQLQQSKVTADGKAREQAARISVWVERQEGLEANFSLQVMNRSPDPVSAVRLSFTAGYDESPVSFAVLLQSLPPCSQVSIPEKALEYYEGSINDNRFELPDAGRDGYGSATPVPYSPIRTVSMAFVDYNGVAWVRTDKGLAASNRPPAIPDGHEGRVVGQPSLESLKSCSDYSADGITTGLWERVGASE